MRRTRAADNTGVLPAMVDAGSEGYATAGPPATVFSADMHNIIIEEMVNVATMKGAALDTTGATLDQCETAVSGSKAIEAKNAEATGVDSFWTFAVIASDDATVGEDAGGVVHAAVIASQNSQAKGFESVAIACTDSRAGNAGGTTDSAAVIASEDVATEGDHSLIAASQATAGTATSTALRGAIIASTFDADATYLGGTSVAIIAANDALVDGLQCAIVGGTNNTVDDPAGNATDSGIFAGTDNAVDGDQCVIVGGSNNAITNGTNDVILGGGSSTIDSGGGAANAIVSGATCSISGGCDESAILGGNGNEIDSGAIGSVIVGGNANTISRTGCVIAASDNSTVPSTATAVNVAVLASKYCDSDAGGGEENYMVVGGYHASALTAPSWKIESNGGEIYATDTSVNAIDYAELFPNADGKAHDPGRILTRRGRGASLAKAKDRVLGVVSVTPTVLGGSDALGWNEMYLRDKWGAQVWDWEEEVTKLGPDPKALAEKRRREKVYKNALRVAQDEAAKQGRRHATANMMLPKRRAETEDAERVVADLVARIAATEQAKPTKKRPSKQELTLFAEAKAATVKRLQAELVKAEADAAVKRKLLAQVESVAEVAPSLNEFATMLARADAEGKVKRAYRRFRHEPSGDVELAYEQALAELAALPGGVDMSDLDLAARTTVRKVLTRKLNPAWDRELARKHKPRTSRPDEWTAVGLLGQVRVAVDATVKPDSFVVPLSDGIGTHSDEPGRGRPIECMEITSPYDAARGYAIAFCVIG